MGIALYILISYLLGVFLYTLIVKNDAMHKHNPLVKISDIIKQGLRGMGIGFLVVGALIGLLYLVMYLTH
jgi:hypothetical protein